MAKDQRITVPKITQKDSRTPIVVAVSVETIVRDGQLVPDPDKVNPALEIGQAQR